METATKLSENEFRDSKGRTWDVTLTLGHARRVDASDYKAITDKEFSILKPDEKQLMEVLNNSSLCFAVIWVIVQPQVKEKLGIDPAAPPEVISVDTDGKPIYGPSGLERAEAEFLDAVDGPTILAGREALWGAIANFFPEQRIALSSLLGRLKTANQRMRKRIEELGPKMDQLLAMEVDKVADNLADMLTEPETKGMSLEGIKARMQRDRETSILGSNVAGSSGS